MKRFSLLLLILLTHYSFGQFAVVNDKDGYCNVRDIKGKKKNVLDRLNNGHLIYCFETDGKWTSIDYPKHKMNLSGKLFKNRYILISEYRRIPMQKKSKPSRVVFKRDSIQVVVTQQKFQKAKHTFSYYKAYKNQIEFIDNKRFWGTDGYMPKTEYKSIEINICGRRIVLPPSALENLYQTTLLNTEVFYDTKNDILYIQSFNSNNNGAYEVIWKIEKGIYKERFIEYGV